VSFLFFPILSQDICREPQKILDQAWIYMPDACCRGRNVHAFEDGEYFFRELCPHFQALFSGHGVVFKIYLMLSGFIKTMVLSLKIHLRCLLEPWPCV
jgi:hypothetical protein